jgi:hypothetical protein
MKVLVCGGSRFKDKAQLYRRLDALHAASPITLLINGGARGADFLASQWAKERGVPLRVYRADWKRLGENATIALNGEMLETERPDLVLACPGGPVTADMIARADAAGIDVAPLNAE